MIYGFLTP